MSSTRCRSAALFVIGLGISQTLVADDFATLFNEDFKGISLALPEPNTAQVDRPQAGESTPAALPGLLLSAEELRLVLQASHPVAYGDMTEEVAPVRRSYRERFVNWLARLAKNPDEQNAFSALAREPDELGVRVDIDATSQEVLLGYRLGF